MPICRVDSYVGRSAGSADVSGERARTAAELDDDLLHLRTKSLPEDATALQVFEAPSAAVRWRAAELAALKFERIVEAVEEDAR